MELRGRQLYPKCREGQLAWDYLCNNRAKENSRYIMEMVVNEGYCGTVQQLNEVSHAKTDPYIFSCFRDMKDNKGK